MKKFLFAFWALMIGSSTFAQSGEEKNLNIEWTVFADLYYSYDFNRPADHTKPSFIYNHNRHNEVNLNLGLIQAEYKTDRVRGTIGLQAGTYPQYNYSSEPELLRHVYQANVGVKLAENHNLWLDVGVMPSHLGYESAISSKNWTLTRTLMAESSPYYLAGAKLGYTTASNKWFIGGMLLNGWQHIARPKGNHTPAFGTQVKYTPTKDVVVNWSTFIGNDYPDSIRKWRYFNNFYTTLPLSAKWAMTAGFDIAMEQKSKGSHSFHSWYTPNLILRYMPNDKWALAARAEYYSDKHGIIIDTGTPNGFKTFGASMNVDRKIGNLFWWRTELRTFNSKDAIFNRGRKSVPGNTFVTTSFAVNF